MKVLFKLFSASIKSLFAHKTSLLLRASFMMINNLLYIAFWFFIFRKTPSIVGWTLDDVMRLEAVLMLMFGVATSFACGMREMQNYIQTGALDIFLLRPFYPLTQIAFSKIDLGNVGDFVMGVILFIATSHHFAKDILLFPIIVVVGGFAWFSAIGMVYSLLFWKTFDEHFVDLCLNLIIGISGYPEPMLGKFVRTVSMLLLPVGLMSFLPIRFVRNPSLSLFIAMVAGTGFLFLLAKIIFDKGIKKYESGSGWSVGI